MARIKQTVALTVAALTLSGNAFAYVADGYLNDWLNAPGSGSTSANWSVNSNVGMYINGNDIRGQTQGTQPFGGQSYDAEYMMADVDWTAGQETLYVAVVTGVAPGSGGVDYPDRSGDGWRPGDLALFTGNNTDSNGNPSLNNEKIWAVYNGTDGVAWSRSSDPYSSSLPNSARSSDIYGLYVPDAYDPMGSANGDTGHGSVSSNLLKDPVWFTNEATSSDLIRPTSMAESGDTRDLHASGETNADLVVDSTARVAYTTAAYDSSISSINFGGSSGAHYVIETAISLTSLGWSAGDDTFSVALQWTMNCANDWINGAASFTNTSGGGSGNNQVPEPTSLALLALGLVGMGYGRKRASEKS